MAEDERLSHVSEQESAPDAHEELPAITPLTRTQSRLVLAGAHIRSEPPDRADFLHTVMCQVGLPRRRTEARSFERHSGYISILLEAGKLYNGRDWVDQPLPYGYHAPSRHGACKQ